MCLFGTKTSLNSTCFNRNEQNVPNDDIVFEELPKNQNFWDKKQRRCYQRLLSGIKKGFYDNERLRFMTLSSPSPFAVGNYNDFDGYKQELQLSKDFQTLRKRILKAWGFKMEYCRVRTDEGEGVLHLIYKGKFIPVEWLRENWEDIHSAPMVDIQEVVGSTSKKVAGYIVSQHLAGQYGYVRMSWSWGWVCRGFVKKWKEIINVYADSKGMKYCINLWDSWLMGSLVPDDRAFVKRKNRERLELRGKISYADSRMWWLGQGN